MFLPVQVCVSNLVARILSTLQHFPGDAHIPVSASDHHSHVPVVTGTVPPTLSADPQKFRRSVMEISESNESLSDLGLGIIDTACLFCVAGSDWWANYKIAGGCWSET